MVENIENQKVKNFDEEAFIEKITKMADDFVVSNYKENALKELEALKAEDKYLPNCEFIVQNYPDFNHIELKATLQGALVIKICVNPEVIKEDPQVIPALAELYKIFLEQGAKEI